MMFKKFKKKIIRINNDEKGISIVIALGITALLIGLCTTYIIITQTENKASVNFNNLKISRMLAESGLRRSLASMQAYSAVNNFDLGTIRSHKVITDQASDSEPYFNELESKITTIINGISYYEWPTDYNASSQDALTWIYISDGDKLLGRIAYAVVPDKGKIDPSSAIDSGVNAYDFTTFAASEEDAFTMIDNQDNPVIGRPGRSINELYLSSLSSWFTSEYAEKMSSENADPAGELAIGTRWNDFATIFSDLGIDNSEIEDSFRKVFSLYSPKDPEAFWIDISNNSYKESSELFHRFNLFRNDWNSLEVDSIVNESVITFSNSYSEQDVTAIPWIKNWKFPGTDINSDTMSEQIAANLIDYCDSDTEATTDYPQNDPPNYVGLEKVPYINELTFILSGETSGKIEMNIVNVWPTGFEANFIINNPSETSIDSWQVAFNMPYEIHHVWDAEFLQESHIGNAYVFRNASYNGSIPAGGSRTFGITVQDLPYDAGRTADSVLENFTTGNYWSIVKIDILQLELVNMFDQNYSNLNSQITISGNYNLIYRDKDGAVLTQSNQAFSDKTIEIEISNSAAENYSKGEYLLTGDPDSNMNFVNSFESGVNATYCTISNLNITSLNVKLFSGSDLLDYSSIVNADTETSPDEISTDGTLQYVVFNAQVNDPRQNLFETDWDITIANDSDQNQARINTNSTITGEDIESKNINCDPAGGDDPEAAATQPWEISTAFIRNSRMLSPWELGFIHRAAPWQTLNLKEYNSSEGVLLTAGGNRYSDGDANILDQVKMSSEIENYGKININTDIFDVLKVLFQKIYVGSNISSNNGPGDQTGANEIDSANAVELATFVLNKNGTNGGSVFDTRAQIVRNSDGVLELCDNTLAIGQNNDATQEEIIGKFINLTKAAKPNLYTIIAIGESIKDVGGVEVNNNGNLISTEKNRFDIGADEILSSYKIMIIVQLDSATNKVTILRFNILSD